MGSASSQRDQERIFGVRRAVCLDERSEISRSNDTCISLSVSLRCGCSTESIPLPLFHEIFVDRKIDKLFSRRLIRIIGGNEFQRVRNKVIPINTFVGIFEDSSPLSLVREAIGWL